MLIYTESDREPTVMKDGTSCPNAGGPRAFMLDSATTVRSTPKLLEVAPLRSHRFTCRPGKPCSVVVTGYGLQESDHVTILPADGSCPPEDLGQAVQEQVISSKRQIRTSSKTTYDYSVRPQNEQTIMTVFDLKPLDEGKYIVCYATSRSTRGEDPVAKDFHYKAGEIGKDVMRSHNTSWNLATDNASQSM
ncbi:hypothetical protein TGME49_286778 [Toxoplasma gondii ME49]|uniref:Uncharacterized protein n=1 Tax=Toxoplasma gondii (strain ATCC 50611 / Me49) TaxID=508771 RepID=S8GR06_TOXGM|nr:hypothetical protein TGME49_286778 [Toxoplasma gondii ME49]EPT30989.1 hypothetical protein TGME49_286778 [Toxoplasma gondii ME49]|eukprot:XP_018637770.1 hypothetical protein TGME49_286778 [Toxoplasma gondii ME49]